jgi:hypothetical protein
MKSQRQIVTKPYWQEEYVCTQEMKKWILKIG